MYSRLKDAIVEEYVCLEGANDTAMSAVPLPSPITAEYLTLATGNQQHEICAIDLVLVQLDESRSTFCPGS